MVGNTTIIPLDVSVVGSWLRVVGVSLGGVLGVYVLLLILRAFQFANIMSKIKKFEHQLTEINGRLKRIEKRLR